MTDIDLTFDGDLGADPTFGIPETAADYDQQAEDPDAVQETVTTGPDYSDNALAAIGGLDCEKLTVTVPVGQFGFSPTTHTIGDPQSGPDHIHFVGVGVGEQPRFVAPPNYEGVWLDFAAPRVTVEDITIDRHRYEAGPQIRVRPRKQATFRNVLVVGRDDTDAATGALFGLQAPAPGSISFDEVRCPHGATWTPATAATTDAGRTGVVVEEVNAGTITLSACEFSEFARFGVDARSSGGDVRIDGGLYRNSNRGQIRVGGGSDGIETTVDGARAEVDLVAAAADNPATGETGGRVVPGIDIDTFSACRGIVYDRPPVVTSIDEGGSVSPSPLVPTRVLVRNSWSAIRRLGSRASDQSLLDASAAVWGPPRAPAITIRRSDIHCDVDGVPGLHVENPPTDITESDPAYIPDIDAREVSIAGTAQSGSAVVVDGRRGEIHGCVARPGTRQPIAGTNDITLKTELKRRCPRRYP